MYRSRLRLCGEGGQVLVLSALLIPLVLLVGVISVDIGNWWVHSKRLQTLVDAGAFAGATKFVGCSFQFGDPPAANLAVRMAALEYSGDTTRYPGTRNLQEQEPDDVRVVLNSARYWQNGDPTDGAPGSLDDTLDLDSDPLTPGDPCASRTLDVKATDDDAPLLFGFIPYVADPKKHARVEIQQVREQAGMLPWAVPEVDPAAVAAIFVDENTGEVSDYQLLMKKDDVNLPFSEWSTSVFQEPVPLKSENTGIVILVSKTNNSPSLSTGGAGTLSTICGQAPGLVKCYAGSGNTSGLTFIHGWSDAPATPAQPKVRDVSVLSVTCGDDLSAPYFLRAGDCELGAMAVIDFGITGNPTKKPDQGGASAQVVLKAPGCGGGGCGMAYQGQATSPTESIWMTTNKTSTLAADLGRTTFSIDWSTELPSGAKPSGTFTGVAHPYVANDASGPIEYLKLGNSDGAPDSNTRNQSPPERSVIVTVGLNKPFQIQNPLTKPVLLRVASPSGSQNQAFDCDQGVNFRAEIENGCQTTYRENYDDWDGDGFKEWQDIFCAAYPNGAGLPPDPTDPVPNCVRVETGDKIGQFRQGLSDRF